ncbi:hypothetical protein M378DRAFT_163835 [Amanita muscaria Koide BX008]|uniref:DUF6699 domain-containing protein n=1 Tax=Amanita muscaria (strain Koide BX008) TaxID=946122 RepID=A0A0C2X595_AMAMK|nr:hypothetical protein M378DRAFT_163835 [Amanita muscaria Koide BX008]
MPGKHVRFSTNIATVHAIPPSDSSMSPPYYASYSPYSSSSSSSSSTLSDSDGPITPPTLDHDTSPYSCTPLPTLNLTLNTHLNLPAITSAPHISFDLTLRDPTPSLTRVPYTALAEPATYPPVPYLTIVHKKLPWQIRVTPSDQKLGYVTVRDVVFGLPAFLRHPASKGEYELVPGEQAKKEVSNAYLRRCKTAVEAEKEKATGLRRVDFLQGRTVFYGLTQTSKGPEVWELHTTTGTT